MSHVSWGVLGAAQFARNFMAPALHLAPGGKLAALATRSTDKIDGFQAIAPDLTVHDSYDALLADPAIDAVYIPLPNTMHVDWTLKALAAGKHVLTEKPIAMQAGEIDRLIAARDDSGLLAAEAYMIVHHPQWQFARDQIKAGAIGDLVHVSGMFCFDNADPDNIRNKAETGGGALRDIGCYVMGGARFATGQEPGEIRSAIRWENGYDVFSQIDAQFPGFTYHAVVSTRLSPAQEMVFYGRTGTLRLTTPFNAQVFGEAKVEIQRGGAEVQIHRFGAARQYELQVAAFNTSVRTGAAYPCPLEFSKGTQIAIDQVFANARTLD
ncbi:MULTISPECIES: Gfo/Idh/MocA family protein [unclassified Meridianimarinicoccus]|uniref:Gfo/Idh/MocA family protein n=1 Tax=unclassified Meridianimarinicoccus TaxID=2923344 RepID=UPI0018673C77|nr:Gfo/Idh/MocA family oxidoreductase [Fluviibacterium sp. MJW13]